MPDLSAAERAREVKDLVHDAVLDALYPWLHDGDAEQDEDLEAAAFDVEEAVMRVLLADPSLLAALAVEAGGMEWVGWYGEHDGHWLHSLREHEPHGDRGCVPVYRRVEGERDG